MESERSGLWCLEAACIDLKFAFWNLGEIDPVIVECEQLAESSHSQTTEDSSPETPTSAPIIKRRVEWDRPQLKHWSQSVQDFELFNQRKLETYAGESHIAVDYQITFEIDAPYTDDADFMSLANDLQMAPQNRSEYSIAHLTQPIDQIKSQYKPPPKPVVETKAQTISEPTLPTPSLPQQSKPEVPPVPVIQTLAKPSNKASIDFDRPSFEAKVNAFKEERKAISMLPLKHRQDINEVVNQVTSDINDTAHLQGRIGKAVTAINICQQKEVIISYLAERISKYAPELIEVNEVGLNFALNFTRLVLGVSQSFPGITEQYMLALVANSPALMPAKRYTAEDIIKRMHCLDISPEGLASEDSRIKFTTYMNKTRGFGMLLGQLLVNAPNTVSLSYVWTWIAELSNTPPHLIDRATLPALHGFLLTTNQALAEVYKVQWTKLLGLLKAKVFPMMKLKFLGSDYSSYTNLLEKDLNRLG